MLKKINILLILCQGIFFQITCYSQQEKKVQGSIAPDRHNIFQYALKVITRHPLDSAQATALLNTRSEKPYLPYNGKGIRHITIKQYGFEQTFTDTTKRIHYFGTKILHYLHTDTKSWVIKQNLYVKEKTALNPLVVADNERYLRSLPYIQDARIVVKPIAGMPDSVDLEVITKDLFSLTVDFDDVSMQDFKIQVGDANAFGTSQSIYVTNLLESPRSPDYGYGLAYSKNNLLGTFINASGGVTSINPDLRNGTTDEHAGYVELTLPLVSQYLRFAGNILAGKNFTINNYDEPDSIFYKYSYTTLDAWIGYNLGVKNYLNAKNIKKRKFVGLRYFNDNFSQSPYQLTNKYNFMYNSKEAVLGSITFFKQNFYKTNYIYDFGTTEDIPYGYNISVTSGWYRQLDLKRLYAGIDANKYVYTTNGAFIQYFLRTGTFVNSGSLQDAELLAGTGIYSKLFVYRRIKIRQYVNLSFTRQFNRIALDALSINNAFGVRYFSSDSALGDTRISLYSETTAFLNYKLFGFKFSPFTFGSVSLLKPQDQSFTKTDAYYGLGAGMRTRNENLIFNTVELRFVYFPRSIIDQSQFKIYLTTNISFKLSNMYVHEPDIIQVNNDSQNTVY